ncbi:MAG: hypothetical protein IVW57_14245, partial [Ktedonobacterales bacterium]|nr:hypothetical protein [Ktedonobacterales bacterium]
PQGEAEIDNWQLANGYQPTHPPTIFGPFVADHTGAFEITSAEQSYHTTDSAKADYHCCTFNIADNFAGFRTLPIQLGDEATAWTGIRNSPTDPGEDYEELTFNISWRHGPVISTVWLFGAHNITFDQAVAFARLVDQRITQALQPTTRGAFHVPNPRDMAASVPLSPTVYAVGCCSGRRPDRA